MTTNPTQPRGVTSLGSNPQTLAERLVDTLDTVGLPDALPDLRGSLEYLHELQRHRRDASNAAQAREALVDDLVARTVTPGDAVASAIDIEARALVEDRAFAIVDRAKQKVLRLCGDALVAAGPTLIEDVLRPAVDTLVAEAEKIAQDVPSSVRTDTAALHAGGKVATGWVRAGEIAALLEQIHETCDELRSSAVLDVGAGYGGIFEPWSYRYRMPALLGEEAVVDGRHVQVVTTVARYVDWNQPPQLLLLDAIRNGAGPTLLSHRQMLAVLDDRLAVLAEQRDAHKRRQDREVTDELARRRSGTAPDPVPAA